MKNLSEEEEKAIDNLFNLQHINTYLDLSKESFRIENKTIIKWKESIAIVLNLINRLEKENRQLKVGLNDGLDKEKKGCFYEDGHTGKCLGYSFFNDDRPCTYCQTCDAISIKESD